MSINKTPADASPAAPGNTELPLFSRKATGLVREVSLVQQTIFNASAANTVGVALIFALFAIVAFPRANLYVAIVGAAIIGVFVWTTFALLSAAIPRIGGDYTFNSRTLHPAIGLGGNAMAFISSLLAVGVWGWWAGTQGLSPAFTVIGSVTDSETMTDWGEYFSGSHEWVSFVTGCVAVAICSLLAIRGTRTIVRVMTTLFLIALTGFVIDFLILLFTSHASFVHTVDEIAGSGTYDQTVEKGASSGLYPTDGYDTGHTIGAIYTAVTALLWVYWGTYMTAEFKGGGQRSRQLKSIVGAGLIQSTVVFIAAYVFLHTIGYDFFLSALSGNFTAPGGGTVGTAGYVYFAALVAKNTFIVSLLAIMFLGWWLPGQYINAAMMQRALLTWSFDGIAPKRFSTVSDRTHTPVTSIVFCFLLSIPIVAWVSFSSNFFAALSVSALYNFFPIGLVGVSAFLFKRRQAALYKGSPAEWRIFGIEVLPVVGVGTLLSAIFLIFLALHFHTNIGLQDADAIAGLSYFQLAWITPLIVFAAAAIWFYIVRHVRRSHGVDIALAYKMIPPD